MDERLKNTLDSAKEDFKKSESERIEKQNREARIQAELRAKVKQDALEIANKWVNKSLFTMIHLAASEGKREIILDGVSGIDNDTLQEVLQKISGLNVTRDIEDDRGTYDSYRPGHNYIIIRWS